MSTRSFIVKENSDGNLRAVYAHWDGYPTHNGRILLEHYSNSEKLEALLDEGDISSLKKNIGEKHDFGSNGSYEESPQVKNEWTTFYGRDRGETEISSNSFDNIEKFLTWTKTSGAEYLYVFTKDDQWVYSKLRYDKPDSLKDFNQLTLEVCTEDVCE